jgi:serine/threonine protein kinase
MTGSNEILGTAAYLAPEQILGDPVGAPADVYSLGLVLLECLTGELEYPGVSKVESALARLHRPPRVPAGLPPALAELLTAMTARCPTDRPTAAECAIRLSGVGAGRLSRRHKGSAVFVGWRRFAIAGSSLAIAIIASAWMLTSLLPRFSPSQASPGISTRQYGTTDRVPAAPPPDPIRVAAPMAVKGPAFKGDGVPRTSTSPPSSVPTDAVMISTLAAPSPATTADTTNAPVAFGPSQAPTTTPTPTTEDPPTRHRPPRTILRRDRPTPTPNPR